MQAPVHDDDDASTRMVDAQDTNVSGRTGVAARLGKLGLAVVVGLAVGWGVQQWWLQHKANPAGNPPGYWGAMGQQTALQALQAWVVVGGQAHSLDQGQISLPSGTRFQIRVRSAIGGEVRIQAMDATGQVSIAPLWIGTVQPQSELATPTLRLEGTKGRETLVITIVSPGHAPTSRTVHLWHY